MTGEVSSLEHELGDDTVEAGSLVSEPVLARSELAEVASGLGDDVVVQLEDDAARGLVVDGDVELQEMSGGVIRESDKDTDEDVGHVG